MGFTQALLEPQTKPTTTIHSATNSYFTGWTEIYKMVNTQILYRQGKKHGSTNTIELQNLRHKDLEIRW